MSKKNKNEELDNNLDEILDKENKTTELDDDIEEIKDDDLEDLPSCGAKTAEKLKESGFNSYMSLATANPSTVAEVAEIGEATARKIIQGARNRLDMGFETGLDALEKRKKIGKITTGSKSLDALMGGGFETKAITECYGAFGSAKTQIAHQIAVTVQFKKEDGGLNGCCLFIDTENTFRPERIEEIAEGYGLDKTEVLKKIYVARAYNSDHQMLLAEKAKEIIKEKKIRLIIVDSMMNHFRSEFIGRGTLADRQQKLNKHLHELQKLSDSFNCCIYITNQVMSKPNVLFGDPTEAIGGHIIGHTSTFRLYLKRSKKDLRIVKLVDSPNLPDGETIIKITKEGIKDE
jgi:DNA repair protein RadA